MTRRRAPAVLLTLGRLPVALELARAFAANGYRVIVADSYRWPIARVSRDVASTVRVPSPRADAEGWQAAILDIVTRESIDHVQPVSEEAHYAVALRRYLPAHVTLGAPDAATYTDMHDKWRFASLATRFGFSVPVTERADAAAYCGGRVVKPRDGCSGRGVYRLEDREPLPAALATLDRVVQQRIEGISHCTLSVAANGRVHETVGYRPLLEYGSVAVRFQRVAPPDAVLGAIDRLIAARGLTGLVAFDFIVGCADGSSDGTSARWWVIECNPRATSGIHLTAAERWVRLLTGDVEALEEASMDAVPADVRQEAWSVFTVLYGRLLRGRVRRAEWAALFSTSDVTFRRCDPWPFLLSPVLNLPTLWRSLRSGRPIVELLTDDIVTTTPPDG